MTSGRRWENRLGVKNVRTREKERMKQPKEWRWEVSDTAQWNYCFLYVHPFIKSSSPPRTYFVLRHEFLFYSPRSLFYVLFTVPLPPVLNFFLSPQHWHISFNERATNLECVCWRIQIISRVDTAKIRNLILHRRKQNRTPPHRLTLSVIDHLDKFGQQIFIVNFCVQSFHPPLFFYYSKISLCILPPTCRKYEWITFVRPLRYRLRYNHASRTFP